MSIIGDFKFCDGGVITIIDDKGRVPSGPELSKWLFSLPEDKFLDALFEMWKDGILNSDKAERTLNAYLEKGGVHGQNN